MVARISACSCAQLEVMCLQGVCGGEGGVGWMAGWGGGEGGTAMCCETRGERQHKGAHAEVFPFPFRLSRAPLQAQQPPHAHSLVAIRGHDGRQVAAHKVQAHLLQVQRVVLQQVCVHACMCVWGGVRVHACMRACVYVRVCVCVSRSLRSLCFACPAAKLLNTTFNWGQ